MKQAAFGLALSIVLALSACTVAQDQPAPSTTVPHATLRVLAGSELKSMAPILEQAEKSPAVNVKIEFTFTGSLDGAQQVANGGADGKYDATWFASSNYLRTFPKAAEHLSNSAQTMASPVVLGVRQSTARRLGWDSKPVTWRDIVEAARKREFTFAMTDPNVSNSGFAALLAITSALEGSKRALSIESIDKVSKEVSTFFSVHRLTAGSSDWLIDAFVQRNSGAGPEIDGLVNYESSLVALNREKRLAEPLTLVYPTDGVIVGDYPLTLLTSADAAARDAHKRLTDYLRTPQVQREIGTQTARRPVVPGIAKPDGLTAELFEIASPDSLVVSDALLTAYNDHLRRPSRVVYVLDVSGSMGEHPERLAGLKQALRDLTGAGTSLPTQTCGFRKREEIVLLPFNTRFAPAMTFTIGETSPGPALSDLQGAIDRLQAGGGTAIYDSLMRAYDVVGSPDRFTSVVLMTDGENTHGSPLQTYLDFAAKRPSELSVPVFTVLFGEASEQDLKSVSSATGGMYVDARTTGLSQAFCEIRGYQ